MSRKKSNSKYFLRFAACFLGAALIFTSSLPVYAEATQERIDAQQAMIIDSNEIPNWPQGPVVTAESAVLMEAETGTILYSKNMHLQEYPASCTKILTCLIAAERCSLDEMVYMSHAAVFDTPRDSNHIALDEGESITMEQALNAILIRSANEVSFAVGEHISGTTWQDFADIMNERAAELGCLNSHFVNPNGLPDENHYTTAYDLAMIGRAFFDNELLCKISRSTRLDIPPSDTQPDHIIENTSNQILPGQKRAYEYLVGAKTGYTNAARNCLVSCAEKDGLKLICVVMKDEAPAQYEDTISLFNYGFSSFNKLNVSESETRYNIDNTGLFYSDNDIFGSSKPLLALNTEDFIILPKTASFHDAVSSISYDTQEEDQAALITYTFNGVEVGTAAVNFVSHEESAFRFDDPMQPSLNTEEDPESEEEEVVFINVIRVLLWVLLGLAAVGLLILIILFLRSHPIKLPARRRRRRTWSRRRRRFVRETVPYLTVSASLEQKRKDRVRQARRRRRGRRSDY